LPSCFEGEDDLMIGARRGSPLAVGHGDGQMYLGSDAIALAPFTNRVTFLEEGDWVVLTRQGLEVYDSEHRPVVRPLVFHPGLHLLADKAGHRHFMAKEIAEQPDVVGHTLAEYIDFAERRVRLPEGLDFARLDRLTVTACGTAFFAGLVAKYWFERLARLPVEADIASEFRYREAPLTPNGLAIVISQSGETADTLAALRYCREQGQTTAAIVNVAQSTIARECDVVLRTFAGPGDRGRLDQGLHLPACGAGLPGDRGGPRPRHAVGGRRDPSGLGAGAGAAAPVEHSLRRKGNRRHRPAPRARPRRALSGPRHQLSDCA
jgi:glutamine---fructose-6-phosphate transaminase (isomerizing)